jgi:hypothetical protein
MSFIIRIVSTTTTVYFVLYFSLDGKRFPTFTLVEASVASVLENSFNY